MSNIIDILTDDRFKMNENDNAAVTSSLAAIEKVFNEISKKTAGDVTTNDMKQLVGALQNFSGTVNDKNALVVDGTNILDVANILGRKVAAKEKYNAEQSNQQQQGQQQAQPEKAQQNNTQPEKAQQNNTQPEKAQQSNAQPTEETPVNKADTSAILNYLGKTREILIKKLNAQGDDKVKVKEFLNEVIIGIDEAINAAKELNGEVNNNSTPSN